MREDSEGIIMGNRLARRGVGVFLVITFGGAWGVWAIGWLLGMLNTGPTGQLVVAFGAFAPALATFVVRRWITREGFGDAGLRPYFRQAWPYYLVGWLLPLPVVAGIVVLATALGISPTKP